MRKSSAVKIGMTNFRLRARFARRQRVGLLVTARKRSWISSVRNKFVIPIFTALLFLMQAGATWWLWNWLGKSVAAQIERRDDGAGSFALVALILFLLGKYSSSLAGSKPAAPAARRRL